MNKFKSPLPNWLLERYLLEELSPDELTQVRAILDNSPMDMDRLRNLEKSNKEILGQYPITEEVREIKLKQHMETVRENVSRESAGKVKAGLSVWLGESLVLKRLAPAAGLLAVLILAVLPIYYNQINRSGDLIKGLEPHLKIYLQENHDFIELSKEDSVFEGNTLQLRYNAPGKKYGTIFSVDGHGQVTLHYPEKEEYTPELKSGGKATLKYAYELDDAPEFECFYFLTSDTLFDLGVVLARAGMFASQSLKPWQLAAVLQKDFDIEAFNLKKGSR